jgi:hypothetical protein
MKVKELIAKLNELDGEQNVEVEYVYDGAARGETDVVWVARNGNVLISARDETIYEDYDRPVGAPTKKDERYWSIS